MILGILFLTWIPYHIVAIYNGITDRKTELDPVLGTVLVTSIKSLMLWIPLYFIFLNKRIRRKVLTKKVKFLDYNQMFNAVIKENNRKINNIELRITKIIV